MVANTQKPISIPEPTNDVDSLWKTTQALKEAVEILQGIRGNRAAALDCDLDDQINDLQVQLDNAGGGGTALPAATEDDMLYYNGADWVDTDGALIWEHTDRTLGITGVTGDLPLLIEMKNTASSDIFFIETDWTPGTSRVTIETNLSEMYIRGGSTVVFPSTIACVDGFDVQGLHISMQPSPKRAEIKGRDGDLNLDSGDTSQVVITSAGYTAGGCFKIKEAAARPGGTAGGFGYLWVKNTAPTELWFTDDDGTSMQIGGETAGFNGLGIWRHRTETGTPPSTGQIRFDNADPTLASNMYIHETNNGGTDVAAFLNLIASGSILYIQDKTDSDNYFLVEVSSNSDSGAYRTIGITSIILEGTEPSQNQQVALIVTN